MNALDELILEAKQQTIDAPARAFTIDRRDFLKTLGGGLLVSLAPVAAAAQESGRGWGEHKLPTDLNAWIHIAADGRVSVFTGKVEVGQNIRTSLAQLVAEELRVPFDSITMVMGDTDLVPWDMGTFGSRSTPTMGPQLANMASAARELLVKTAAQRWNADAAALTAADGRVTNQRTNQSVSYGELTRGEKLVETVEGDPPLTPPMHWKIAGTPIHKANGQDFVTGKHQYPSDIARPEMMFGKVLRAEGYHASLASLDTANAEKIPTAKVVHDGEFIGVAAGDLHSAETALAAIDAKWSVPAQISNRELFDALKKGSSDGAGKPDFASGSVADAMASAEVKLEQHYTVQYIAHTPLEPRAAVAEWSDGKLTVWTGTQRPFGVRDELMEAFHLPADKVRVIQPDMGSGYGGKHSGEAAIEAARLAKSAGKPVKVLWTRAEEFTWAYFRPAGWIEVRSGARHDGTLVAWEHHNYNSGPAAIQTPYTVANQLIQFHPSDSPLRQGSYRGLAATANHFAREVHMDEMAHALGMEPLEFRLKNLNDARLRAVFEAAAEKFGWGKQRSTAERGFGFAGGMDKGGRIACCAEVKIGADKKIRIRRVVEAWESGATVNPDGLRNQVMGGCVQAIGGALFEAIEFKDGRILNPHLAQYRVPRFSDVPAIEVVLVDRKDIPSAGAGETGLVALAPAVSNAVFAATGVRLRSMPMAPLNAIPGDAEPLFRA
jgi:isoquinoline 1-oxidoreductase